MSYQKTYGGGVVTAVPATRSRQEVEVVLEAPDSFARIQLPDGRVAVVYGNGQLNVTIGTETRYHGLPVAADPVPSRRLTNGAAPRCPARPAVVQVAPAPVPVSVPAQAVVVAPVRPSGIRFDDEPGRIRRR